MTTTTTTKQIQALRTEAEEHGDHEQAMICVLALGGPEALEGAEPGTAADTILRAGRTQEWALAECERVIRRAQAERDGDSLVRVAVDYETAADDWWTAARASESAPQAVRQLLGRSDEITVPRSTADEIVAWAATLPGWDTGVAHAPHPLHVDEATSRKPRGGSKPRVGAEPAEHTLRVRLDPATLDRWREAAEARGGTLSDLVREAVEAHLVGGDESAALAALANDVLGAVKRYRSARGGRCLEWKEDRHGMHRASAGFMRLVAWCSAPGFACWEIAAVDGDRFVERMTDLANAESARVYCEARAVELLREALAAFDVSASDVELAGPDVTAGRDDLPAPPRARPARRRRPGPGRRR